MPVNPSSSVEFKSWEQLLKWLPGATETQLMTVLVWAQEQEAPTGEAARLAQVRKEAFEQLLNRCGKRLRQYLARRLHCRDDHLIDDVLQQVFLKLYLRAEQFDPHRSFWGWLYRIARNEYVDALRRRKLTDSSTGPLIGPEGEPENWLQAVSREPRPDEILLEQERQQALENAIASLPARQRAIVQWKREGMSGKDIANRLGVSQAYVSQSYHEASYLLREMLEP